MNKYKVKNKYYDKINKKVEDGTFLKGNNYYKYLSDETIKNTLAEKRTRDFYINAFTNDNINEYIKNHIEDFDRQFFKDLIESNEYAMCFKNNCFSIMPLDYIDEEMCSLAILKSKDWSDYDWFLSVYIRKPEALTEDLWKLAVRLYASESRGKNKFLNMTPEEYKDNEYFIEMCSCSYNGNCELDASKGKIMDTIPQELITPEFLVDLLCNDVNSISSFNEKALETRLPHTLDGKIVEEKAWQIIVRIKGDVIRNIPLNDERVEFFLKHYDKDSEEYIWSFKDEYKEYLKKKRDANALAITQKRSQEYITNSAKMVLKGILEEGKKTTNAIDEMNDLQKSPSGSYFSINYLPIKYEGVVPQELRKQLDTEEYLEMMYKKLGIQIICENDKLFYEVNVPKEWTVNVDGNWNYIYDNEGNLVLTYFDGGNFWDRSVYVKEINLSEEITDEIKR